MDPRARNAPPRQLRSETAPSPVDPTTIGRRRPWRVAALGVGVVTTALLVGGTLLAQQGPHLSPGEGADMGLAWFSFPPDAAGGAAFDVGRGLCLTEPGSARITGASWDRAEHLRIVQVGTRQTRRGQEPPDPEGLTTLTEQGYDVSTPVVTTTCADVLNGRRPMPMIGIQVATDDPRVRSIGQDLTVSYEVDGRTRHVTLPMGTTLCPPGTSPGDDARCPGGIPAGWGD